MKDMKKYISMLMLAVMVFALASCGASGSGSEEGGAEDGQNPVMNFIGDYACDRATMHIEADGMDGAKVTVDWGSSAAETSEWVMSGTFYEDTLSIEYHDCVRTDYVYAENGDVESKEEVYVGGHGFIKFSEGSPTTLTWQEDQEHVADDMVFEYVS